MAYDLPNYTPVPNAFFDVDLSGLSGAEVKVLLVIFRFTLGYIENKQTGERRRFYRIPIDKIRDYTGLGKTSVIEATKILEEKGLIRCDKTFHEPTIFWVLFKQNEGSESEPDPSDKPSTGSKSEPSGPKSEPKPPSTGSKSEHLLNKEYKEILNKGDSAAPASVEPEPGTDAYRERVRMLQEKHLKNGNMEPFVERGTAEGFFGELKAKIHHVRDG